MGILGFNLNLTDQLAFYGSYHHNKWNQVLHFVFVPAILWSVAVWLAGTGPLSAPAAVPKMPFQPPHIHLPAALSRYFVPNGAAVLLFCYGAYYIVLEWFAGASWALCMGLPMYVGANAFDQHVHKAWAWALGVFILSWYMQIHPGHIVLEKRKPALMDSFFQSLVLAPLFVWMELLFVFGYRPQLQQQLQARIKANIAAYSSMQQQKQQLLSEDERHADAQGVDD